MITVVSYGDTTERPPRSIAKTAIAARLKHPWSHGRAYAPIVAIVLLVFVSLIVLHLHWFTKKLLNAIAS
jgi:hypothetical protein